MTIHTLCTSTSSTRVGLPCWQCHLRIAGGLITRSQAMAGRGRPLRLFHLNRWWLRSCQFGSMLVPLHPCKSNCQAIPFLVDGLYQDHEVIGGYRTAVQVYSRRGGSIDPWSGWPWGRRLLSLVRAGRRGFYPWHTRLGFLPADILPPTTTQCSGGSGIICHGMVHFSDPTGNARSGFALNTNIWLTLCGRILTDFASQRVFLWWCIGTGLPWVLVP